MAEKHDRLFAIHEAIWIRDNANKVGKEVLIEKAQDLSKYGLFSNRQISKISGGRISHVKLRGYISKSSKTGGRFSPDSLEDLALVLFSKERENVDFVAVKRVLDSGTSQGMISRLTGVSQSSISRKFGGR
jgi:hypothetical protein